MHLDTIENYRVIAQVGNGQELIDLLKTGPLPDLVMLDLNMPVLDGYDTAAILKEKFPTVKVLVVTMYDSDIALIRVLKEGVRGFLRKDVDPAELNRAITSVIEKGYYYSHDINAKLSNAVIRTFDNQTTFENSILTETEIEFLRLASTDLTYKEIATRLKLSPRTIDHYREGLFAKLNVRSRVGLAIFAIKHGIVSFD